MVAGLPKVCIIFSRALPSLVSSPPSPPELPVPHSQPPVGHSDLETALAFKPARPTGHLHHCYGADGAVSDLYFSRGAPGFHNSLTSYGESILDIFLSYPVSLHPV